MRFRVHARIGNGLLQAVQRVGVAVGILFSNAFQLRELTLQVVALIKKYSHGFLL